MKRLFALLLVLLFTLTAVAQKYTLSGTVTDEIGEPLPFGTIYIQRSNSVFSANEYGQYKIELEKGNYQVTFKFIGYQPQAITANISKDLLVNVKLKLEIYQLKDTTVNGSEDPANRIIRQVIRSKASHLNQVNSFSASVYIKGVQKLVNAPAKLIQADIKDILHLDSNGRGILYMSESESNLYFQKPDKYREIMTASRTAGKNESFAFNKATDLIVNFYKNILQFNELTIRGFISPIADYAFVYYKYRFLGSFKEDGRVINKIQVIPRRKHDPVFSGVMYIVNGSWQIHSLDLYLIKQANINFVDTLRFNQQFLPINGDAWLPSSMQLNFKGKVLGFSFDGHFLSVYNNYNLNPGLSDRFFNGETLRVNSEAENRDNTYWNKERPIPLSREEVKNYHIKDSVEDIQQTKPYLDSVEKATNTVTLPKIALFGYTLKNLDRNTTIAFSPILPTIIYNTVEGFGYQYQFTFKKVYNYKNSIEVTPQFRYGFSNKHFNPSVEAKYFYDPINKGFLSLRAGSEVMDITNLRSSVSITNSINTLIYEINRAKLYEKQLINFTGSYEAGIGLFGTASLEYGQRQALLNNSYYRIIDRKNREFSSNNPFYPNLDIPLFPSHKALTLSAELDYAPAAHYISRPEGRFYEPFKYPRIVVAYKKGFRNMLGSDVDFDFGSVEVYQNELKLGMLGKVSYTVKIGGFFNNRSIYYPDFYHYRGNNSLIFERSLRNFHFLDIYRFSTDKQFFEAHYEHNLGGFITNKIPLLRKLNLQEILGGAYLDEPAQKNYYEVFFGLQRLIFRVDYALAFSYNIKVFNGVKITYGFGREENKNRR